MLQAIRAGGDKRARRYSTGQQLLLSCLYRLVCVQMQLHQSVCWSSPLGFRVLGFLLHTQQMLHASLL